MVSTMVRRLRAPLSGSRDQTRSPTAMLSMARGPLSVHTAVPATKQASSVAERARLRSGLLPLPAPCAAAPALAATSLPEASTAPPPPPADASGSHSWLSSPTMVWPA